MSVSILEALENAEMNIDNEMKLGAPILLMAKDQLRNARVLLEKGYDPYDEVEPLLEQYGSVDDVPEKPE